MNQLLTRRTPPLAESVSQPGPDLSVSRQTGFGTGARIARKHYLPEPNPPSRAYSEIDGGIAIDACLTA